MKSAKSLPAAPAGRPAALAPERKREIVYAIGALHNRGVRLGVAQARVAQRFGAHKRTMQRVWQQRATLNVSQLQTIEDLWRFIGTLRQG